MTGNIHIIFTAASGLGEIAVLCLAGFIMFRRRGNTFAEAAAYAIMTVLMVLSCLFQSAFLTGVPALSMIAETGVSIVAVVFTMRSLGDLRQDSTIVQTFFSQHRAACSILSLVCAFLAIQAVAFPPGGIPWKELWPVLGFQKYGTFFATGYFSPTSGLIPVNSLILPHLFLRFNTGAGVGVFGFLAFLSIGFSTYALCRRYSWPPTAITITMVVLSMPRLAYHAMTPGMEIIPAAAGLFSLLALYRVVEQPNFGDLLLLLSGILFSISGDRLCLVFPSILLGLSCLVLSRRHGIRAWWQMIRTHWRVSLPAILPLAIFSQCWLFVFNRMNGSPWVGSGFSGFFMNTDGIQGSLANMLRYFIESAHFTRPVEMLCQKLLGFSPIGLINQICDKFGDTLLGGFGAAAPFGVSWTPEAGLAWFGPLGFLLILPALFYAMLRGPRRLRAVAVAMVGYGYLITLIPAWIPGNARYFTVFYVCCGFMGAFFLPPWRFSRKGKRGLQVVSALILIYSCTIGWLPR